MKKIIYPGTFDPITNGHLDIAERAAGLFDHVILVIANNPKKNSLFTVDERIDLIQGSIENLENISVSSCLLYTSDAADDTPCVDLGGRRIIK